MKVIARKSSGVSALYFISFALGVGMFILGFFMEPPRSRHINVGTLGGSLVAIVSIIILLHYFSMPKIAIAQDEQGRFHVYKDMVFQANEILDVSYKRARARSIQYRWGRLILTTVRGEFRFHYIADVEDTCKYILTQILSARFKNTNDENK